MNGGCATNVRDGKSIKSSEPRHRWEGNFKWVSKDTDNL